MWYVSCTEIVILTKWQTKFYCGLALVVANNEFKYVKNVNFKNVTLFYLFTEGSQVTNEVLDEVREISSVMPEDNKFLTAAVQRECERVVPDVNNIRPQDAADTFIFLKTHFVQPTGTVEM